MDQLADMNIFKEEMQTKAMGCLTFIHVVFRAKMMYLLYNEGL